MTLRSSRLAILVVSVLLPVLAGCGGTEPASAPAAPAEIRARTAVVKPVPVPDVAWVTGSVTAARRAEPGTKILGRVQAVTVDVGDAVRAGQILVRLEDADLRAAVAQADAAIAMAEAQVDNAHAQHARMTELHGRGSVTDKNLEDAVAGLRVAEAQVEQARANAQAARAMLAYATVASPFEGVMVAKHIEPGDMARPGAPLFAVEDLSSVDVVVNVPEARIAGRIAGETVRVETFGRSVEAPITRIVPSGDPASRTFRLEVRLVNDDGVLKSGMFARVGLGGVSRQTLVLPREALLERGQLRGAWVVADDGTANVRWLRMGAESERGFEILSGLEGGERVVLDPPAGLVDGTVIRDQMHGDG